MFNIYLKLKVQGFYYWENNDLLKHISECGNILSLIDKLLEHMCIHGCISMYIYVGVLSSTTIFETKLKYVILVFL